MKRRVVIPNIILTILCIVCVVPFILLFIASLTDEMTLVTNGYSFFPEKWSLAAYAYLWQRASLLSELMGLLF